MTTPAPLCFVDTETDGVHPGRTAWEVALIRRDYAEDLSSWTETSVSFFIDIDLATADPFGLKVGGFYERHPMGLYLAGLPDFDGERLPSVGTGTSFELESPLAAARLIAQLTHGTHLVGAVPSFDAEVLARLLRDHGLIESWHYHLIDVEAMAVGWLMATPIHWVSGATPPSKEVLEEVGHKFGNGGMWILPAEAATVERRSIQPPWNSDELSLACGVNPPSEADRHTAMGDARWAKRWYDKITGHTKDRAK